VVLAFTFALGVLAAAVLAGLAVRGRVRLSWSFSAYLLSVAFFNTAVTLWPDRFLTWSYWLAVEMTHSTLKVALAIELAALLFRSFPAAGRMARLGLAAIIVASVVWIASGSPTSVGTWIRVAMPRVKVCEAFLLTWLLMVVLWYRIPLHFLHKMILTALAPYLLVFSVGLQAMETFGWGGVGSWRPLHLVASAALLAAWLYAAWRPDEHTGVHPGVAKVVQPWA
jgi:hypothetical protein